MILLRKFYFWASTRVRRKIVTSPTVFCFVFFSIFFFGQNLFKADKRVPSRRIWKTATNLERKNKSSKSPIWSRVLQLLPREKFTNCFEKKRDIKKESSWLRPFIYIYPCNEYRERLKLNRKKGYLSNQITEGGWAGCSGEEQRQ